MFDNLCKLLSNETQVCSRADFISYFLLEIVLAFVVALISAILSSFLPTVSWLIFFTFLLLELIVFIILSIKRLHDINMSGYFVIAIIILPILVLVLFDTKTSYYSDSENKYKKSELNKEDEALNRLINVLEKENSKEK